jgi:hypothetical protein
VDIDTPISMLEGNFVRTYRSREFREKIKSLVDRCPGCLYACWAEMTYLCTDVRVLFERVMQGIRVTLRRRP